jgi:serine phosphatase RsbU (regulator of sigma subunit)
VEIQVAVAKVGKYATHESGDTLEMIERPHGGLSFVLADGQRSGRAAKSISNMVARKAIALLAEGIRDGAAARAAHDYLYTQRQGKVSATLNIVSVDMDSKTIVLSRNSHCPVIIRHADGSQLLLDQPAQPIGIYRMTRPEITEIPLQEGLVVVVFTDGVLSAGQRRQRQMDAMQVASLVAKLCADHRADAHVARPIADGLLAQALELDEGRASDDVSILVLAVSPADGDEVRRFQLRLPIPSLQWP